MTIKWSAGCRCCRKKNPDCCCADGAEGRTITFVVDGVKTPDFPVPPQGGFTRAGNAEDWNGTYSFTIGACERGESLCDAVSDVIALPALTIETWSYWQGQWTLQSTHEDNRWKMQAHISYSSGDWAAWIMLGTNPEYGYGWGIGMGKHVLHTPICAGWVETGTFHDYYYWDSSDSTIEIRVT